MTLENGILASTSTSNFKMTSEINSLPDQPDKRARYILFSIVAVAIALRIWHINWGLPELFTDEAIPFKMSWRFWNWTHPGLDLNPHFFIYPAFTFYLQLAFQAAVYCLGHVLGIFADLTAFYKAYAADPTTLVILARLVTLSFDVGILIVVYLLTYRYFDRRAALFAAFLVALNPLHIAQAHLVNVD